LKQIISSLIIFIVLTACSNTKDYNRKFIGESQDWKIELVQLAKVSYKKHPELEGYNQMDYKKNDIITMTYKGNNNELTNKEVQFLYDTHNIIRYFPTPPHNDKLIDVSINSGSGRTPKDYEFPAVNSEDGNVKVTIKWLGREQVVDLTYVE
jgi:hypothetical protein